MTLRITLDEKLDYVSPEGHTFEIRAFGNSLSEGLGRAFVIESDPDGQEVRTYDAADAPRELAPEVLRRIEAAIGRASRE